jgi:hypothetical protein
MTQPREIDDDITMDVTDGSISEKSGRWDYLDGDV